MVREQREESRAAAKEGDLLVDAGTGEQSGWMVEDWQCEEKETEDTQTARVGKQSKYLWNQKRENPNEEAEKVEAAIMVAAEQGNKKKGNKVKTYMRMRNIPKYFLAMTP